LAGRGGVAALCGNNKLKGPAAFSRLWRLIVLIENSHRLRKHIWSPLIGAGREQWAVGLNDDPLLTTFSARLFAIRKLGVLWQPEKQSGAAACCWLVIDW
jgi:hypothetical protein